jgi:hypothetical protein
MARSVAWPVDSRLPWLKFMSMLPIFEPRPIWIGLMPPRSPGGRDAPWRSWAKASAKVTRELLKPTVFTFAMLFPITSIRAW